MKKIMLTFLALAIVNAVAFAADTKRPVKNARAYFGNRYGGYLRKVPENPGKFVFVNAQKAVAASALDETVSMIIKFNRINLEVQESDHTVRFEDAETTLKATGANAAIFIVDNPTYPMSLVAVESKWAFLNIAPLKDGAKDPAALTDRARKQMWRVFVMLLGGSDTEMPHCLMRPVFSGDELEALQVHSISPEPLQKMATHMKALGIKQWREATYKEACAQGWAPAPTNDVQQKIWNQVHELPTNPLPLVKPAK